MGLELELKARRDGCNNLVDLHNRGQRTSAGICASSPEPGIELELMDFLDPGQQRDRKHSPQHSRMGELGAHETDQPG